MPKLKKEMWKEDHVFELTYLISQKGLIAKEIAERLTGMGFPVKYVDRPCLPLRTFISNIDENSERHVHTQVARLGGRTEIIARFKAVGQQESTSLRASNSLHLSSISHPIDQGLISQREGNSTALVRSVRNQGFGGGADSTNLTNHQVL